MADVSACLQIKQDIISGWLLLTTPKVTSLTHSTPSYPALTQPNQANTQARLLIGWPHPQLSGRPEEQWKMSVNCS